MMMISKNRTKIIHKIIIKDYSALIKTMIRILKKINWQITKLTISITLKIICNKKTMTLINRKTFKFKMKRMLILLSIWMVRIRWNTLKMNKL